MILPIYGYGNSVLRKKAEPVDQAYPNLESLIQNMFQTMYNAHGVGLAAPQIGLPIRIFIVDAAPMQANKHNQDDLTDFRRVFINPEKIEVEGDPWPFEEGCLSIPVIRTQVQRPERIQLRYFDEHWQQHTETFSGLKARIIQHEYDHLEGILFTDYARPLQKQMLNSKLQRIVRGDVEVDYPMRFAKPKKKIIKTRSFGH